MSDDTQGDRIRALFSDSQGDVTIVAPFIKLGALESLLEVIPHGRRIRCVTRWSPREVAAGVSDPEILGLLEERGNFVLTLVDNLHAKLYIAGNNCLAGSSNVTLAGLGERGEGNIEVLVATTIQDPGVAATLEDIDRAERPATVQIAEYVRTLAQSLPHSTTELEDTNHWIPHSRQPQQAFRFYSRPPTGYMLRADQLVLSDIARTNIPPGLSEEDFDTRICDLLRNVPLIQEFVSSPRDALLTFADARSYLERSVVDDLTPNDLWKALTSWTVYFLSDRVVEQLVSEIALRRARLLQ